MNQAMQCTVLLFANVRDACGCDRLTISLPQNASVQDALEAVIQQYPQLTPLRDRMAVAINHRYAARDAIINPNATLAIIPPVSGG